MRKNIFKLLFVLSIGFSLAYATATDYQKLHTQEQAAFNAKMKVKLKNSIGKASKKVQKLYKAIDYQPVWVDKDFFTQYAELLISEIREDLKQREDNALLEKYESLLAKDKEMCASASLDTKVDIEFDMMQLYADHIDALLEAKESKYTALSLLQFALKEKSLVAALDNICEARINYRTALGDANLTSIDDGIKLTMESMDSLTKGDDDTRIKAFYKLINFQPVWMNKTGFSKYTKELFIQIEKDVTLDKNSTIYQSYQTLKTTSIPDDKKEIVTLEFALAKLYQNYMAHALYGEIDWQAFQNILKHKRNADWVVHKVLVSPESLLIDGLSHGSLAYAFDEAKPKFPLYNRLLKGLQKYEDIVASGGWEHLPEFQDLKPDMTNAVIPLIRERLKKEGDYLSCSDSNETERYDDCLLTAVKSFQRRHGLTDEGFIGKLTRKALDESAASKVARIKLNLNRMKWVKRSDDRYHIWVNIPGYEMYMFDNDTLIENMKVIVGRKGHHTPVFYNRVRTIVLNPYWRIPASIIRHELIPKLKKNAGYTNKKHIEIHTGYSEHSPRVNPYKVNWHKYGRRLPPYKFMQSPGKHNALGKVKYLFPNKYSVYMHDTNEPYLFVKDVRALSHGCIRLHKPFELLETFSKIDSKINFEKAQKILEKNKKTPIRLSRSIPIDIIYLTTWVDFDGTVEFRDDIYGYDKIQLEHNIKR